MRWESMCDSVGCAMAWWVNMIMTLCPGRSAARHGDDEPMAWPLDIDHLHTVERMVPMREPHRHVKSIKAKPASDAKSETIDGDPVTQPNRYIMGQLVATSLQQLPAGTGWLGHTKPKQKPPPLEPPTLTLTAPHLAAPPLRLPLTHALMAGVL